MHGVYVETNGQDAGTAFLGFKGSASARKIAGTERTSRVASAIVGDYFHLVSISSEKRLCYQRKKLVQLEGDLEAAGHYQLDRRILVKQYLPSMRHVEHKDVSCTAIGHELHICAIAVQGSLDHFIVRNAHVGHNNFFGATDVNSMVGDPWQGHAPWYDYKFSSVSCANVGGKLMVVASHPDGVIHTTREGFQSWKKLSKPSSKPPIHEWGQGIPPGSISRVVVGPDGEGNLNALVLQDGTTMEVHCSRYSPVSDDWAYTGPLSKVTVTLDELRAGVDALPPGIKDIVVKKDGWKILGLPNGEELAIKAAQALANK